MMTSLRHVLLLACAIAIACASAASGNEGARASLAAATAGEVDADVRSASGRRIGHLTASVGSDGRGSGTLRMHDGGSELVRVRARPAGRGARVRVSGAGGLRLAGRIGPRGRLRASGRYGGRRVRLSGVARDEVPNLRRGMRMLVVGHPRGEGYRALKRVFRPVRLDGDRHSRAALLRDRRRLHGFAALVFGPDVSARRLRSHGLLRGFLGSRKWVVQAPSTRAGRRVLSGLHGSHSRAATPALAVRVTGPAGAHANVRPVISYPRPALRARARSTPGPYGRTIRHPAARLTPRQRRAAAERRARWFARRLIEHGDAHTPGAARAAQAGGSADFDPGYNTAMIQVLVDFYHEFVVSGAQNRAQQEPCGVLPNSREIWCRDSARWRQAAPDGDYTRACQWFLDNGYYVVPSEYVTQQRLSRNPNGSYLDHKADNGPAPLRSFYMYGGVPAHACPKDAVQIGAIQGEDSYFAIFDPDTNHHSVIVLTDPTVSASMAGDNALAFDHADNGVGGALPLLTESLGMKETAWYLGAYQHELSIDGPNLTESMFVYSGAKSFPNNQITFTEEGRSESKTIGFNVGVFGDTVTGGFDYSVTKEASVSISVPSWQVSPTIGHRSVRYLWGTNYPVTWATIAGGCCTGGGVGAPWGLNDLNRGDFTPATLTAWTGPQTYGPITVTSNRTVSLVDHLTWWSQGFSRLEDFFQVSQFHFGDNPNDITPVTSTANVPPGINLCDPAVRAPAMKAKCGA